MKIIDKIKAAEEIGKPYYSFEYFPPKTSQGLINLYDRIGRMSGFDPLFIDVTWRWGGKSKDLSLEICNVSQIVYGVEANMHMTCAETEPGYIRDALEKAKGNSVQNILALRGDLTERRQDEGKIDYEEFNGKEFYSSVQLIKYIKEQFGDYFCISVAGYPEGYGTGGREEEEVGDISEEERKRRSEQRVLEGIKVLKKKQDAGADFIVTQLFYDVGKYKKWVRRCREEGIVIPIVPGIMPIQNYNGFVRMVELCGIEVPKRVMEELAAIKDDDLQVKDYGIKYGVEMVREILEFGDGKGMHFYTLNLERSTRIILEQLGLIQTKRDTNNKQQDICCEETKTLPWPMGSIREGELVRPIFWNNNQQSYIQRTNSWDEFPNGRWGDFRSPAYGELVHGMNWRFSRAEALKLWGTPKSANDVADIFVGYIRGTTAALPWSDAPLSSESSEISDYLQQLNKAGLLTINSQPSCNAVPSTDPVHGWGPPNGFVFKKAYLEFFVHKHKYSILKSALDAQQRITYLSVTHDGLLESNLPSNKLYVSNAVTWGCFPASEILQPTIVDANSFMAWKDEAYDFWTLWAKVYRNLSNVSFDLLSSYTNDYVLMNLVDNDFTQPSSFMYSFLLSTL